MSASRRNDYITQGGSKRKVTFFILALLLVLTLASHSMAATVTLSPGDGWITTATGANVYLRAKASGQGAIRDRIPTGSYVEIVAVEGAWAKVKYGGQNGYVSAAYVTNVSPLAGTVQDAANTTTQTATITMAADAINSAKVTLAAADSHLTMRDSATTEGGAKSSIANDEIVEVLGYVRGGKWVYARHNGVKGYLATDYLRFLNRPATVAITEGTTVNIRLQPSTNAQIVATLSNGDMLTVTGEGGEFTPVLIEGGIAGYIVTSALK